MIEYGSCRHRSLYLHVHHAVAARGWSGDLVRVTTPHCRCVGSSRGSLASGEWCTGVGFLGVRSSTRGDINDRSCLRGEDDSTLKTIFSYVQSPVFLQSTFTRVIVFWRFGVPGSGEGVLTFEVVCGVRMMLCY